jgi:hypothetical protein
MNRRLLSCLLLGAASAGCVIQPLNGASTNATNTSSYQATYNGFWNAPSTTVFLEKLTNPDDPPSGSWSPLVQATTNGANDSFYFPSQQADATALYGFNATAAAGSSWPQGGVLRVRGHVQMSSGPFYLQTYDADDFSACLSANANTQWQNLGSACGDVYPDSPIAAPPSGIGTVSALVSITPQPADNEAKYVSGGHYLAAKGGSGVKNPTDINNTLAYYSDIGAPQLLSQFRSKYSFGSGGDEVSAIYYNQGDLGLGRAMHCRSFSDGGNPTGGRACYVTNYSKINNAVVFGGSDSNVANALAQTIAGETLNDTTGKVASVAMTYTPSDKVNPVKFIVYGPDDSLQPFAQLDYGPTGHGGNTAVPNNCLTCHGADGEVQMSAHPYSTSKAHFLPFDEFSFRYSQVNANYSQAAQEDKFRQLNAHVLAANPTSAITEMLTGIYQLNGQQVGPNNPMATATDSFVPTGWNGSKAQQRLYTYVVKRYCRTCHVSKESPTIDWHRYIDFATDGLVQPFVCPTAKSLNNNFGTQYMPQSEMTTKNFWNSPARGDLVTALGLPSACVP